MKKIAYLLLLPFITAWVLCANEIDISWATEEHKIKIVSGLYYEANYQQVNGMKGEIKNLKSENILPNLLCLAFSDLMIDPIIEGNYKEFRYLENDKLLNSLKAKNWKIERLYSISLDIDLSGKTCDPKGYDALYGTGKMKQIIEKYYKKYVKGPSKKSD